MPLILQEALRGPFYAPFRVALARDAFSAEDVIPLDLPALA